MLLYCFGNNHAIASYDWLGLLVTIDYVANGERKTIRLEKFSLETLLCWLKCIKAQKGIIRQIDFVGHGNDEMILINDIFKKRWPKFPKADGKEGTLALTADDTGIYLRELIDTNGNEKKEDISDTLGDITDSNTVITLNGCNTASGEDNVTRKISNQLPETTVTGNQGFTVMPTWDDVPFNNSVFPFPLPPGRQSYVGGMSL